MKKNDMLDKRVNVEKRKGEDTRMRKGKTRIVAILLVLCTILTGLVIPETTQASSSGNRKVNNRTEQQNITDDDKIFQHLDKEYFRNGKHIARYKDEEKLNTYVFGNEDGTRTVYYMYENVKFKDKDGKIKGKDISLIKKGKGYGIAENEVDLFFPRNPADGIVVDYDGYDVRIIPQGGNPDAGIRKCDDAVIYDGYFGKNASLKYTPLLSGVKEDIILSEYEKNVAYDFIVETDGLYVYNDREGWMIKLRKANMR